MRRLWLAAVACVLLSAGCPVTKFDIRMQPQGDAVQRDLTVWKESEGADGRARVGAADDETLKKLTAIYGKPGEDKDGAADFHATFPGRIPGDMDGSGRIVHYTSALGTATAYVEQLGGTGDQIDELEGQLAGIDKLVEIAIGWLDQELGKQPAFVAAKEKLAATLRKDLKNLMLIARTAGIIDQYEANNTARSSGGGSQRENARAILYLVEHDYVTPQELPRIVRAFAEKDEDGLCPWLQRMLARKLGVPDAEPVPAYLGFLGSAKSIDESWKRYEDAHPEIKKLLDVGEQQKEPPQARPRHNPTAVITIMYLLFTGQSPDNFFGPGRLARIAMACPVRPVQTNGTWHAEAGEIRWDWRKPSGILPPVLYALWAEPNAAAQTACLGRAALTGTDLADYVFWRNSLSANEGKQWDAFVASLKPGRGLAGKIKQFHFTAPTTRESQDKPDPAEMGRSLLLKALEAYASEGNP